MVNKIEMNRNNYYEREKMCTLVLYLNSIFRAVSQLNMLKDK